ncbi:MAG: tripartite tricarboxylate transporter permease [Elusimicrobiota bacterium]
MEIGPVIVAYVILGTFLGAFICSIPALHIYNVAGIAMIAFLSIRGIIPYYALGPFFMSLVVAFAFINTVPMTFFNTADESAGASMLPSTDMVTRGRGKDASLMTGLGTLTGVVFLAVLYPYFMYIWPYIASVTGPHLHWILGLVIVHYLMSEWPKGAGRGDTPWQKFKEAWRNLFAGLATFTLAALFGLIFLTKPILPIESSFQNVMPIFIGFFAIPSIIQALISDYQPPEQYDSDYVNAGWEDFSYGLLPGFVGGMMAAYLPAVTAGIGAMWSSHVTNHRNLERTEFREPQEEGEYKHLHTPEMFYRQERIFLIAGGMIKLLYYVGAFLLLFVLTELTPYGTGRGGLTFILKPIFTPEKGDFFVMLSTIIFSGSLAFLLLIYIVDWIIKILPRLNLKMIYVMALLVVFSIIYFIGGGWLGVGISLITTSIGLIPVFYNCRRSHCMAVLLVPIAVNMAGYGDAVARIFGLI